MSIDTSHLFNSAIASFSLSAAAEMGIFDRVHEQGECKLEEFCVSKLHFESVEALILSLTCFDIFQYDESTKVVRPGEMFEEAFKKKSYFVWLIRGYGHLMANLALDFLHGN